MQIEISIKVFKSSNSDFQVQLRINRMSSQAEVDKTNIALA